MLRSLPRSLRAVARRHTAVTARAATNNNNVFAALSRFSAARRSNATSAAAAAPAKKPDMFCFQCEQTRDQKGCTTVGVCGKTPDVAALQDVLVNVTKGISQYATKARAINAKYADPEVDRFVLSALFSTVTNVNFSADRITEYIQQAAGIRDKAQALYRKACNETRTPELKFPGPALVSFPSGFGDKSALLKHGEEIGILSRKAKQGEDKVSLIELITYGLKGTCAYADHALWLGYEDPAIYAKIHEILAALADESITEQQLWGLALETGALNLKVMALLDKGHTSRFGHPTPTQANTTPVPGKCILVSGHDLSDLEALLKQTEGTGITVWTHGEMLPAHGYPGLKKYKHLAGHFGGPWQLQKMEFAQFPGSIVITTNCLVEPRKAYKHRIFTRSVTGFDGVQHLPNQDFSKVIQAALNEAGFTTADASKAQKPILVGFGHNAVMSVADKVIDGVKSGAIKRFFVIGGCDGSEGERSYFKDVAAGTPKDSMILTMGCGKYRFNRLDLGDIGGIPRVLDLGQCNDSYSGIEIALALSKAFNVPVNELPLSFAVSWFEQKAVAVLLTLLHLNIKNIRLGPNLPGFATPNMVKLLVDKFQLKPTGNVTNDLAAMMAGK